MSDDEMKTNGQTETQKDSEPPPEYPKLARFARYFHRPCALQLKEAIVQFEFGGEMDIQGRRFGVCLPAYLNEAGEPVALGRVHFLPNVILQPSSDGETVLAWLLSPRTGAVIEMNIAPEQIEYVTCIARSPSPIAQASSIVTPGN